MPAVLDTLRPWREVQFTGQRKADSINVILAKAAIRAINADSSHAGGVRIRFLPGATFANLVEALNILSITDQRLYWLDVRREPLTIYAITTKERP